MAEKFCCACGLDADIKGNNDNFEINCPKCGYFKTTTTFFIMCNGQRGYKKFEIKASGYIHDNPGIHFDSRHIEIIKKTKIPSLNEKINRILLYSANRFSKPGTEIDFYNQQFTIDRFPEDIRQNYGRYDPRLFGYCWVEDVVELKYLLEVATQDYKYFNQVENTRFRVISSEGWKIYDEIKYTQSTSNVGFIAMAFKEELNPVNERIKNAITEAGYDPLRIDDVEHCDDIMDKIIVNISSSKFVVADFTYQRGGVYFEAGFARGLDLPVIWTVKKADLKKVHFDINHMNILIWTDNKLQEFKDKLTYRIESILGKGQNL